jgi:hypothetical protein
MLLQCLEIFAPYLDPCREWPPDASEVGPAQAEAYASF